MNERMKTTLRAWPVVAALTIALCALTKIAAEALGIDLPDQQNVGTLRAILLKAFDSPVDFLVCLYSLALVVAVLPAAEEGIFRFLLFRLPARAAPRFSPLAALVSAALFSAAHYIFQPFPDNAFVALFFFGLAQCWLYQKTGRLWCAALDHALFNLTNIALLPFVPA